MKTKRYFPAFIRNRGRPDDGLYDGTERSLLAGKIVADIARSDVCGVGDLAMRRPANPLIRKIRAACRRISAPILFLRFACLHLFETQRRGNSVGYAIPNYSDFDIGRRPWVWSPSAVRACGIHTGSRIEKRLPLPISLSTPIVPPCASTNSLEMASPNPLPCTLVPGTRK